MCGIVAVLAKQPSFLVLPWLVEGLQLLQNRGYDSCGGVLWNEGVSWTWKGASTAEHTAFARLAAQLPGSEAGQWRAGCFQTRWATHGAKTDQNAHPHCDAAGRFYVVHNGILTNYAVLKARLQQKGYVFRSQTDTEVVVHMMADCVRSSRPPVNMLEVWRSVVGHLEGTWSLVLCDAEHPSWLYVAKHGSPLLLAYGEDGQVVGLASEPAGLRFPTGQYRELQDGAVFIVDENLCLLYAGGAPPWVPTAEPLALEASAAAWSTRPDPYPFWTELEIRQQPVALREALNRGGRLFPMGDSWQVKLGGLDRHASVFHHLRHVVLVGCGSSWHACLFAARVFRSVTTLATVQVFDASEFTGVDVAQLRPDEVVLVVVSQSGETHDCQRVVAWAQERALLTVGVVNGVGSWLARHTTCGIYLNAGREVGVASTKSFTSQCVVLTLLALWLCQLSPGPQRAQLAVWGPRVDRCPDVVAENLPELEARARVLAPHVALQRSVFLLGRSWSHAVALEGALKLKELTYQNVEGYAGGALKHGPFSVLGPDATVFLSCWEGPEAEVMLSAAEQVASRGARVVVVHNAAVAQQEQWALRFPGAEWVRVSAASDEWSAALVSVVLFQYLAYFVARVKGLNPDQPRHLAKVVTVAG